MAPEKIAERVVEGVEGEITAHPPVASPRTSTGTVIFETGEDLSAEEIQSGGVNVADVLCGQVVPLLRYLDGKVRKYAGSITVGSYVKLVRNRTQAKVATTHVVAEKERQLQEIEAKYEVLRRRLIEEIELRRSLKKICESLRADIEVTRSATVDLWDRLKASRIAYNEKSRRVDELTADSVKDHAYAAKLVAKVKALAEFEAAKISDLALIERLEAKCNEMRSQ